MTIAVETIASPHIVVVKWDIGEKNLPPPYFQ
jgi:hypothetical protein